ncbi:MAG: hypothetical protein AYK23_02915 [Candidatus Proteinoplasmatales archaeon SG8-5]|nr:MAG: hypothetical protein AYK23_02915 [Candidatus Proteinoplasmatales archaeon SG8-5]
MLVLVRLYPTSGLAEFWKAIEFEKRNLYWKDIKPLYAIQQEGKRYLSIVLDVRNLESLQKDFLNNIAALASVRKIKTIPLMTPIYFPIPKGFPKDCVRFQVFLRVKPNLMSDVYTTIISFDYPEDIAVTYLSYSFGDDDIIISMLGTDRESVHSFLSKKMSRIDGVVSFEMSRVIRSEYMLPPEGSDAHRKRFQYSSPAGKKGRFANSEANQKYLNERAPLTAVVRLFASKDLGRLWDDIEKNMPTFESKKIVPLYASQQEDRDYVSVILEAQNFEVLREMLTGKLPALIDIRKTRTVPMLEPTYFLLPKTHPEGLERHLITLQVEPTMLQSMKARIISLDFPDNVFLTHFAYLLGEDDIMLSILTDSDKTARKFTKEAFGKLEGVRSYDVSSQVKTKRLTSKGSWKRHQGKYLSSYVKQHRKDYDARYDWTDDIYAYAMMEGAYPPDMEH